MMQLVQPRRDAVASLTPWLSLGWLPIISVICALGLILIAISYNQARASEPWADALFWLGILLLFEPAASRLIARDVPRWERLAILTLLGLALYQVKILHSPTDFTFYDELLHWRTTSDMLNSGRLFLYNPSLPVSSLHPGLETITTAIVSITGLSIYASGVLVIAVARLLMGTLLFLTYEHIAKSAYVAGLATLIYMANPGFVFFDAQFAYESLALPFAVLVIFLQVRLDGSEQRNRALWSIPLILAIVAVVMTHYLTAYITTAFVLLWTLEPLLHRTALVIVRWYGGSVSSRRAFYVVRLHIVRIVHQLIRPRGEPHALPVRSALLLVLISLLWLVLVANIIMGYLGGYLLQGVQEVLRFISNEGGGRELFRNYSGEVAPVWEQIASYTGVLLLFLALPIGFFTIFRHIRRPVLILALGLSAPLYPVSQVLRFTEAGLQISGRTVEFLFIGIAFVCAITISEVLAKRSHSSGIRAFAIIALNLVFVSGLILGWPRWARHPGPYLVSADTRSIETESLALAQWAAPNLGANNRFAADRVNGLLLGSYGRQYIVSLAYDAVNIPQVYFAETLRPEEEMILAQADVRYLVVDERLSTSVPVSGVYFELNEPNASRHLQPIAQASLLKFDSATFLSRLFDSGNIVIYRVENATQ